MHTTAPSTLPRNCTFSETDWNILSAHWYPVAFSREITSEPYSATLLDQKLVIYRHSQGLSIFNDLCLHRGVPLTMGWVEGDTLICKYHGFRYNETGQCVDIPAHPGTVPPPKLCLKSYPYVERFGLVWTCLKADDGAPPILPETPEWDDPNYQQILPNDVIIQAAAGRQVEGFLDVAHFAWIHHKSFALRENPVVPRYEVEKIPTGIRATYASPISNFPIGFHDRAPADFVWNRIYDVSFPFNATLRIGFPNSGQLVILNAASPVSSRKTRLFVPIMRNFDKDQPVEPVYAFNYQVFAEDQEIVERQCPEDLPIDLTEEVHIRADRTSIEYRKVLGELGLGKNYTT